MVLSPEKLESIEKKCDAALEEAGKSEPDLSTPPNPRDADEMTAEEAQVAQAQKKEDTDTGTEVEPRPEADESTEKPAEESAPQSELRLLPETDRYQIKVDGQFEEPTGEALANAWRQRREAETRFTELKTEREKFEAAKSEFDRAVDERAISLCYSKGLINDRGEWVVPDSQAREDAVQAATDQAVQEVAEEFTLPEFDVNSLGDDEYLPRPWVQHTNSINAALAKALSTLSKRVEAVDSRTAEAAKLREESDRQRRAEEVERQLEDAAVAVGAGDDLLPYVRDDMQDLLLRQPHLFSNLPEATRLVKQKYDQIRGVSPSLGSPTSETPPARKLEAPPAVGGGGSAPETPGPEKEKIGLGEPGAVDRLSQAIKRRLGQ